MDHISILEDFSPYPAGRYREHGPHSGEALREDLLLPALREHPHVLVDLNGVMGYASSFLEEAFGGLVRAGLSPEAVLDGLVLVGGSADDKRRIRQFIQEAGEQR